MFNIYVRCEVMENHSHINKKSKYFMDWWNFRSISCNINRNVDQYDHMLCGYAKQKHPWVPEYGNR